MKELPTADLGRLLRLVPKRGIAGHMAFVHAVIDGQHPGWVLVDDPAAPRSALAFNHCGFGFALGEPRSDLVGPNLRELVAHPFMVARPTALWCTEAAWEPVLKPFFSESLARDEFQFEPERTPQATLPDGYRLSPIDAELATRSHVGIDDFVQIWGGPTRFAERSFGVAVQCGNSLVAACTACAIGGRPGELEAEIDIGTAPAHRQKGLAAAAAVAFFDLCRERGVTPAWSCDSKNLASQRAAVHLGFREFRTIIGFPMRLNALV